MPGRWKEEGLADNGDAGLAGARKPIEREKVTRSGKGGWSGAGFIF
jgi:hypothetical protein